MTNPASDSIRGRIDSTEPAPLLAETDESISNIGTFFNSSVGHSGVPEEIRLTAKRKLTDSPFKVSKNQNSIFKKVECSVSKTSTTGIHVIQGSPSEVGTMTSSPSQISREQIGISQNSIGQGSTNQASPEQICTSQVMLLPTKDIRDWLL